MIQSRVPSIETVLCLTLPPFHPFLLANSSFSSKSLAANEYPQRPLGSNPSIDIITDDTSTSKIIPTQETFDEMVKCLDFDKKEIYGNLTNLSQSHPEPFADDAKLSSCGSHPPNTGPKIPLAPGNVDQNKKHALTAVSDHTPWLECDFEADRPCNLEMVFDSGMNVSRSKHGRKVSLARKVTLDSHKKFKLSRIKVNLSFSSCGNQ